MSKSSIDTLIESKASVISIPTSQIRLSGEGATGSGACKAEIMGKAVVFTEEAMNDLYKGAGIGKSMLASNGGSFSPTARFHLLMESLKQKPSKKGGKDISLVFNDGASITRAVAPSSKSKAVSKEFLIRILEFVSGNGNSNINGVTMSDDKTKAVINITGGEAIASPMSGEEIAAGSSLIWDQLGGTSINEFVMRLVCSNGMVGERLAGVHQLTSRSTAEDWYKVLFKDKASEKLAERYYENVLNNKQLNLSVREYLKLQDKLKNYKEDAEYIKRCIGNGDWTSVYSKRGVDVKGLSSAAAANYDTPVNRWDAINCLTNLASNPTKTYVPSMAKEMDKVYAGKMLASTADATQWNVLTPKMNWGSLGGSAIINQN